MPVMKAVDAAYIRFQAPDLDAMESFLLDFGLTRALRTDTRLYMRGCGTAPFLHVTELGDKGVFIGGAFVAPDLESLQALAAHDGVKVEQSQEPGGGHVVRLRDPDGFLIEAVYGRTPVEPLPVPDRISHNEYCGTERPSQPVRVQPGPSHVMRLGHFVLGVSDFRKSEAWYKERFGLLTSDEVQPAPGVALGAFMRCDRGELPADHHTLFLFQNPRGPGFMHAAFEVLDLDDLMAGNKFLQQTQHRHEWGIGRHVLGSQIFDYWLDPWGHEVEHWTDGDRYAAHVPPGLVGMKELLGVQWGPNFPHMPPEAQA